MKLVINRCYGGFNLSADAKEMLGLDWIYDIERNDESLIKVVETLGEKANGNHSKLRIVEVPSNTTDYYINEYDGFESVFYVVDGKIRIL